VGGPALADAFPVPLGGVPVAGVPADEGLVGNDRAARIVQISPSAFMASRMRCIMNQAVREHTPYLRSISRAATPFLEAHISKNTRTQVRSETLEPWKIVPVVTENCFRQVQHCQTRRSLMVPVRVLRLRPLAGWR